MSVKRKNLIGGGLRHVCTLALVYVSVEPPPLGILSEGGFPQCKFYIVLFEFLVSTKPCMAKSKTLKVQTGVVVASICKQLLIETNKV